MIPTFLMWRTESIVRGNSQTRSNYLSIVFSRAAEFSSDLSDLWFLLRSIAYRSEFCVASSVGDRW